MDEHDYHKLHSLLKDVQDAVEENNRMLKDMRREAFIAWLIKTIIWVTIIGGMVYFFINYLAPVIDAYNNLTGSPEAEGFRLLLEQYGSQFGE